MVTIVISGLGLIGGSLALNIKEGVAGAYLIGLDKNQASLTYAKNTGVIDEIGTDLALVAPRADIIILATPVTAIEAAFKTLAKCQLKPGVIITDTGSTKRQVILAAQVLCEQGVTVIGGHPMAGSHKSGVRAADRDLFRSAYYFLVPARANLEAPLQQLKEILAPTHAKFLQITPVEHDHVVGVLSHLPHMLAATLVNETTSQFKDSPTALRLAAGGFKDMTRIASSDPEMWADILLTNDQTVRGLLADYIKRLKQLEQAIAVQDKAALLAYFQTAKVTRDSITPQRAGAIPGFYDLFVNIPDRAGAIAQVTGQLAAGGLQLVNLQILETREEINGILQLTFASEAAKEKATTILAAISIAEVRA
ncbi:prephenate dehydrogenase [Loigolactobacillus iwatensis]|uniref:prephenate dehydrogenase n=1 Tax=Loigolactobacillus iwatensis TaxID=1267156 RepID=UPI000F7F05D4|nr:prephenate dehydrogenase [Loigolactobacillus iwatensis]